MIQPVSLADRLAVLRDALPAFEGITEVLHQAQGPELAQVLTLFDTVSSEGARARTATVAEAVRRDEAEPTLNTWIRRHAPSLQQGGAGQTARLVTEAMKSAHHWTTGSSAPDPESPIGIIWDAVSESAAPEGAGEHDAADGGSGSDPGSGSDTESGPAESSAGATEADPESGAHDVSEPCADAPIPAPTPALTPVNGLAVLSEMRILEKRLRPEAIPTVTKILIELAREWGPAHMRRLRPRLLADYGLDGELDDLQGKLARGAHLSSPEVESGDLTDYRMSLTPAQAAALEAAIGPFSKPVPNPVTGERDLRPVGQRRAEALIDLCQQALAAQLDIGGEGVTGAYAAVHVNINLEELRRLTGCIDAMEAFGAAAEARSTLSIRLGEGWDSASEAAAARFRDLFSGEVLGSTAAGTLLSPSMLRLMACAAHLIPHVLGSNGEQLDQGEEIRLFNKAQRRKLLRRDKHCTYPGCDRPGAWTRAHHVLHWFDGGWSDLDNAALLCEHHHGVVHARRLWAEVRPTPNEQGRYVIWDLTVGSYDQEVRRRRAERALHDPPPMTPQLWEELARANLSDDGTERRWADDLAREAAALAPEDPEPISPQELDALRRSGNWATWFEGHGDSGGARGQQHPAPAA